MKTMKYVLPLLAVLLSGTVVFAATAVLAATTQRYLHVRVNNPVTHEMVRVNVPLSLAEKVIPAINHGKLRNGKVECNGFSADQVNLKAILDALKTAPEGEFVTVQESNSNVRVAKEHGELVVHVADKKGKGKENVDVTIPWAVAQALASDTDENELNVEAAIKALENAGDVTLVAVTGDNETVRIWVDSSSSAE
jgi:ribonuclease HI